MGGEIKSSANKSGCSNWGGCELMFLFNRSMDQTMFRLNFTETFVSKGRFYVHIGAIMSDGNYISTLTFTPQTDQECLIYSELGICSNKVDTTCKNKDWVDVTGIMVMGIWVRYYCEPSEFRFKLTYEYIDCKTGKRLEPPTTTALQTTTAPTTQANKSYHTTFNLVSTESDSGNNPLTTILIIVGSVIAVLVAILIAVAVAAVIYWKNRQQGQEESIAMSSPTHEYEEIREPVDQGGYLSPMPNPNVSVQIPSAYADPQDPDYIVSEDIYPPAIPHPMYDRVELLPPSNLPTVASIPGTSHQKSSVDGIYTEPDYAPPGKITVPHRYDENLAFSPSVYDDIA
ncbi:uncharacterized protein LOC144420829 [Styela clava]